VPLAVHHHATGAQQFCSHPTILQLYRQFATDVIITLNSASMTAPTSMSGDSGCPDVHSISSLIDVHGSSSHFDVLRGSGHLDSDAQAIWNGVLLMLDGASVAVPFNSDCFDSGTLAIANNALVMPVASMTVSTSGDPRVP